MPPYTARCSACGPIAEDNDEEKVKLLVRIHALEHELKMWKGLALGTEREK